MQQGLGCRLNMHIWICGDKDNFLHKIARQEDEAIYKRINLVYLLSVRLRLKYEKRICFFILFLILNRITGEVSRQQKRKIWEQQNSSIKDDRIRLYFSEYAARIIWRSAAEWKNGPAF
jgi:hypothetical protein